MQTVRYRLRAGLHQEVIREAQRRAIAPSRVVEFILSTGLPALAAMSVRERIGAALDGPSDDSSEHPSNVGDAGAPLPTPQIP